MDQLTTAQSKSRFRPVNISAAGLPGGPLPVQSVAQDPTARPAVIRTVVGSGGNEQGATVRLLRQDETSQPKPRMLPEQRLEKYVEKLRATKRPCPDDSNEISCASEIQAAHRASSVVTWSPPQASRAINLSEALLTQADAKHYAHSGHTAAVPHLQGWPDEQEGDVEAKVEAQLEQATALDEQLRQLELRIEKLRVKEDVETNSAAQAAREQEKPKACSNKAFSSMLSRSTNRAMKQLNQQRPMSWLARRCFPPLLSSASKHNSRSR